ncbi:MAG: Protein GrpE [Parcubacteria group bacterium GW2011_GWC2_38_7]|nr:MAG: Protein GrpE [Parcubacteria group bacterium GW2011_GWC2_38_7]
MDKKKKVNHELDELKQQCGEYLGGWKRAMADYQNLQKETALQKSEWIKNANAGMIIALLPILDNFKMAYRQIPEAESKSAWVVGFSHIKKQLEDLLTQYGVEEIVTVGQKFNLLEHEAIGTESDTEKEDQIILVENKPGYKLNGKVIQVAKVTVNHIESHETSDQRPETSN